MQLLVLVAAVVVSLGAALATAAGILRVLFVLMAKMR